jgi:putative glutathione S-transferase
MGLEDAITVDVCFPNRSNEQEPLGPNLWKFAPDGVVGRNGKHTSFESCTADTVNGKTYVKEIYELAGIPDQQSLPILFDKVSGRVVSNESSEILRMFGTVMKPFGANKMIDLYPEDKRSDIEELNDWVYTTIANGSYKAGFSSSQEVYETAYTRFFAALDKLENEIFSKRDYLVGDSVTEADVRLFPALFRLDPVYQQVYYDIHGVKRSRGDTTADPRSSQTAESGTG